MWGVASSDLWIFVVLQLWMFVVLQLWMFIVLQLWMFIVLHLNGPSPTIFLTLHITTSHDAIPMCKRDTGCTHTYEWWRAQSDEVGHWLYI